MIELPSLSALVHRQLGRCCYCGERFDRRKRRPTIDHKDPIWAGGRDTPQNRAAACMPCNDLKGPLDAESFMKHRRDPEMLRNLLRQVEQVARCRANAAKREALAGAGGA